MRTLKKLNMGLVWTGCYSLRIGTNNGPCERANESAVTSHVGRFFCSRATVSVHLLHEVGSRKTL